MRPLELLSITMKAYILKIKLFIKFMKMDKKDMEVMSLLIDRVEQMTEEGE